MRSHSSCLFDTGQSLLVDFGLRAMHGDIDRHVTCMKTFDTMLYVWRHLTPCDMRGDINRHVTCMETFDTM